ncbi:hypothetical protein GWI33_010556 [Rhynchophorus ferrugineus]|uniref:Uncharacterized protein n=1 Tax=Rhynchophorus ferrugineus TaxID=354439 RepID=A0A834ISL1_RHYFE|nr:hypothetical protein GWI33_010556 [Rhynchophorus ferrugineus]
MPVNFVAIKESNFLRNVVYAHNDGTLTATSLNLHFHPIKPLLPGPQLAASTTSNIVPSLPTNELIRRVFRDTNFLPDPLLPGPETFPDPSPVPSPPPSAARRRHSATRGSKYFESIKARLPAENGLCLFNAVHVLPTCG